MSDTEAARTRLVRARRAPRVAGWRRTVRRERAELERVRVALALQNLRQALAALSPEQRAALLQHGTQAGQP